ncbi:hypothetical protein Tco_1383925 [Tanacetum coccineum]
MILISKCLRRLGVWEAHQEKGEGEGDDADLERAIKLSLDPAFLPQGRAPVGGVMIRDPVSETTSKLHEVVGQGKGLLNDLKVTYRNRALKVTNVKVKLDSSTVNIRTLITMKIAMAKEVADRVKRHMRDKLDRMMMKTTEDAGNDSVIWWTLTRSHAHRCQNHTWFKPIPESERLVHLIPVWTISPNDFPEQKITGQIAYATTTIRKEDSSAKLNLKVSAFNLVKAFQKNSVFLQYQMDECHKLLTNKVD